jgi:DNA-binding CsgD family transcriptional regulator
MPQRICLECMTRGCHHMVTKRCKYLTSREQDIIRQLVENPPDTAKELAYAIHMAHGTLGQHLTKIYAKLGLGGVGSWTKLARWAEHHSTLLNPPSSKAA